MRELVLSRRLYRLVPHQEAGSRGFAHFPWRTEPPVRQRSRIITRLKRWFLEIRHRLLIYPNRFGGGGIGRRSEEHTSELQSRLHLVCRLLLEKKKEIRAPFLTA